MDSKTVMVYPHLTLSPQEVQWGDWTLCDVRSGKILDVGNVSAIWNYELDMQISISVSISADGLARVQAEKGSHILPDAQNPLRFICEVWCPSTSWSSIGESKVFRTDNENLVFSVEVDIPGRSISRELKIRAALITKALRVDGTIGNGFEYIATLERNIWLNAEGSGLPFSQVDFTTISDWDKNAPWVIKCNASDPEAPYESSIRVYVNTKHPVCNALVNGGKNKYDILQPALAREVVTTLVREIYLSHIRDSGLYAQTIVPTLKNCEDFQVVAQEVLYNVLNISIAKIIALADRDWASLQSKIDGATDYLLTGVAQ